MNDKNSYFNKYLYSREFDYCKTSDASELLFAVDFLCENIGYQSDNGKKHMRVVFCDLYSCCAFTSERYIGVSLDPSNYDVHSRYNPNRFGYRGLKQVIDGLVKCCYLEIQKGYFNRNNEYNDGFRTRIRATQKMHDVFKRFAITGEMIVHHPNTEVLILKGKTEKKKVCRKDMNGVMRERKVNIAPLVEYNSDHKVRNAERNKIIRYNNLLARTYIDINVRGFRLSKERKEDIYIDLSEKLVRRIFNNKKWTQGGRFYGGWWQRIPGELRGRIIINGHPVVENDYSGQHVHIMYAMVGKKMRDLGKLPYIVKKGEDPENIRPFLKKLLLTSVNCQSDRTCIREVMKDWKRNPEDYPNVNIRGSKYKHLKKLLERIKTYHPDIEKFINKKIGLKAQYIDSEIACTAITELTKKEIPVLCVHDSFVCMENHEQEVFQAMKDAYINVINSKVAKTQGVTINVTQEDVETDLSTLIERVTPERVPNAIRVINKLTKPGYEILAESTKHQENSKLVIYDDLVSTELRETHRRVLKEDKELYERHTRYKTKGKTTFCETVKVTSKQELQKNVKRT